MLFCIASFKRTHEIITPVTVHIKKKKNISFLFILGLATLVTAARYIQTSPNETIIPFNINNAGSANFNKGCAKKAIPRQRITYE